MCLKKRGKENYNFPLISQQIKTHIFGNFKSLYQRKQLLNGVKKKKKTLNLENKECFLCGMAKYKINEHLREI